MSDQNLENIELPVLLASNQRAVSNISAIDSGEHTLANFYGNPYFASWRQIPIELRNFWSSQYSFSARLFDEDSLFTIEFYTCGSVSTASTIYEVTENYSSHKINHDDQLFIEERTMVSHRDHIIIKGEEQRSSAKFVIPSRRYPKPKNHGAEDRFILVAHNANRRHSKGVIWQSTKSRQYE